MSEFHGEDVFLKIKVVLRKLNTHLRSYKIYCSHSHEK